MTRISALCATLLLLAGCGFGARIPEDDTEDDTRSDTEEPADSTRTCAWVDEVGGVVSRGDAQILVPVGAIDTDTQLCLGKSDDLPPEGYDAASALWFFEPQGIVFNQLVQVTLPFEGELAHPRLYWSNDQGGYDALDGVKSSGRLTAGVPHFSLGFVAPAAMNTDTFDAGIGVIDVLFVIDTSCSMSQEQAELGTAFDGLFTPLSATDYHIGVVTTNMEPPGEYAYEPSMEGRLQAADGYHYIDIQTPDPIAVFKHMAVDYPNCTTCTCYQTGGCTDLHADEMGLLAAYTAIMEYRATDNAGFYRDEADLMIVVLSDENDYSQYGTPAMAPAGFITWAQNLKGPGFAVSFSSIVGDDLGGSSTCATAAEPGRKYLQVTGTIGGVAHSICDDNAAAIDEIAQLIATPSYTYELSQVPVPASITVTVGVPGEPTAVLAPSDFAYDAAGNTVSLVEYTPPPGALVEISYVIAP